MTRKSNIQMIKYIIASLLLLLAFHNTQAQQVRPDASATIYSDIARLQHLTHVLYIAAHPDDENTRLLAWLAKGKHINTAYLSLTRGDGGQNLIGKQLGSTLGLIRTHELLEARKLDGAKQFFTRAVDFGFSKSPEETFKHWNEYVLTNDVVRIIRQYRPDVIICRFPPDSRAGHGQHSVSAIIAAKAFRIAGDESQFTEHFTDYKPWQAKRLLWNTYKFGSNNTTAENQFKIKVGQYNALLGMGYGELAGISRSLHKSQGAGTPSVAGIQTEYFSLVDGDSLETSLFDGIDISWNRVGRPEIEDNIKSILHAYDFNHPEKSLEDLLALRAEIKTVKNKFWRKEKLKELDQIILSSIGFMAEASTTQPQATAGETLPFVIKAITRANIPVQIRMAISERKVTIDLQKKDSLYSLQHTITIPATQAVTQPYWLAGPEHSAMYSMPSDSLIGLPNAPNNLAIPLSINIDGTIIKTSLPLSFKKLDPLKGDVVEALRIVPPISIELTNHLTITQKDGSLSSAIKIHTYKEVQDGNLAIYGNNKPLFLMKHIQLKKNTDTTIVFQLSSATTSQFAGGFYIDADFETENKLYNKTVNLIEYDHLPTLQYLSGVYAKVVKNDWKTTAKRIGYVEGAGDYTASLLRLSGVAVDILKPQDLSDANNLKNYDAIITGIRVLNTHKEMRYWMPVLLAYAKNGGTLIMQYNTLQEMATKDIGPYPLPITNKRTTEEDATITFLLPKNRLLNYPNKITPKDFDGWLQERGLYYPVGYDSRYQSLFSMHDAGEEPLEGATVYTPYGKGHYIYTSLSFNRQLPAGNKGAIRLLMNMISVGK